MPDMNQQEGPVCTNTMRSNLGVLHALKQKHSTAKTVQCQLRLGVWKKHVGQCFAYVTR